MAAKGNDPLVVLTIGSNASLMMPLSKASEVCSLLGDAECVDYSWSDKAYKPRSDNFAVEIKFLTPAQIACVRMADPE